MLTPPNYVFKPNCASNQCMQKFFKKGKVVDALKDVLSK